MKQPIIFQQKYKFLYFYFSKQYKAEADLILSTERKKVFKTFNFLGTDSQEQYIHQRYQLEKDLIEDWRVTINAMENKKYNEHQEKCKEDIEEYRKLERDIIVSYKILSQQVKDQSICFDITNLSSAVSDLSNCLLYNKSYKNELERVVYIIYLLKIEEISFKRSIY